MRYAAFAPFIDLSLRNDVFYPTCTYAWSGYIKTIKSSTKLEECGLFKQLKDFINFSHFIFL